jgi:hypothetical protein
MKQFKKNMGDDAPCTCQCGGDVPEDFYWPGMDKVLLKYREQIKKTKLIQDVRP